MKIAIVTFEGFNELDSFVASAILNRIKQPGWKAEIVSPNKYVTSMNGVRIEAQQSLAFANDADVVLFGSGINSRGIAQDDAIMSQLKLSPQRQLIGSQCSGALFLHSLGLANGLPLCTDTYTAPYIQELGASVIEQPFIAHGDVASAGGCLSSQYLAFWVIARTAGLDHAKKVLHYVAPVGHKDEYVERALTTVESYL